MGSTRGLDDLWKGKKIKRYTEKVVFSLSEQEVDKCRYEIVDQTRRMAECKIHRDNFSHGVRLHPPHLYNIIDGIVFFKDDGKWVKWKPNFKARVKDIEDLTREQ